MVCCHPCNVLQIELGFPYVECNPQVLDLIICDRGQFAYRRCHYQ